jgi:hypothetical protein
MWFVELLKGLGPFQPHIQWVPGVLPGGKAAESLKLTTHLHVVPRLRVSGAVGLLPLYVFME